MDRIKIKEMLLKDIQYSLKSALNIHNVEIKIKNLIEAVDIASLLLEEFKKEERIHDILYYVEISFNVLISPQKLYVMTYLDEVYDSSFFSDIEKNKKDISESHMLFFVNLFNFRHVENSRELEIEKKEFKEKEKIIEEIFSKHNISAKRIPQFLSPIDVFEFIYPLDTEVFWFLI